MGTPDKALQLGIEATPGPFLRSELKLRPSSSVANYIPVDNYLEVERRVRAERRARGEAVEEEEEEE